MLRPATPAIIVDLDALTTATANGVRCLTSFLWSLRVEGAEPVVVCSVYEVAEACRTLKLDRAFPLVASREEAKRIAGGDNKEAGRS